jgi:hypothetical protein
LNIVVSIQFLTGIQVIIVLVLTFFGNLPKSRNQKNLVKMHILHTEIHVLLLWLYVMTTGLGIVGQTFP